VDDAIGRCHVEELAYVAEHSMGPCFEIVQREGGFVHPGEGLAPGSCEVIPLGYLCVRCAGRVPEGDTV
jgi:hypothetical protein